LACVKTKWFWFLPSPALKSEVLSHYTDALLLTFTICSSVKMPNNAMGYKRIIALSRPLLGVVVWEMTDSSEWGVNKYFQWSLKLHLNRKTPLIQPNFKSLISTHIHWGQVPSLTLWQPQRTHTRTWLRCKVGPKKIWKINLLTCPIEIWGAKANSWPSIRIVPYSLLGHVSKSHKKVGKSTWQRHVVTWRGWQWKWAKHLQILIKFPLTLTHRIALFNRDCSIKG